MENPVNYTELWTGYQLMTTLERRTLLVKTIDTHISVSEQTNMAKKRTILARSFQHDAAVLADFHAAVFGDEAWQHPIWDDSGRPRHSAEIKALIRFPSTLGGAVDAPRTVEWTRDALTRFMSVSNPVAGGGFHWHVEKMLAVTKKLFKSGVPLDYVNGFHPSTMRENYPVAAVIDGYRAGLPVEYVAALLDES